ncbi:DUF86 domain-containing protein [Cellulosimicrobium protaetiae]|uniref:DUF86 domain-containing protein n=2 Tax=Cellulosimicrobium protaetiae TaxID=2587808 RepID=A0A6M5ULU9_9MICO|nr:DUF86 domain-containing protein [Cellulosimicrobium protaetiae]
MIGHHVAEGGWGRQVVVDAVCLRLAASIEAASHLSAEARASAFGATWRVIWATRKRIAHGCATVDPQIVRATVENDLVEYAAALRSVAARGG